MYFIPYLFTHVYIFIGCIDFSSWLGLACIVLFLMLTVHSYVAPTLNKLKKKNSILIHRAPDEKAVGTILKVFGMTRPGLKPASFQL